MEPSESLGYPEYPAVDVVGCPCAVGVGTGEGIFGDNYVRTEKIVQDHQHDNKPRRPQEPDYNLAVFSFAFIPAIVWLMRSLVGTHPRAANIGIGV